jgi:hypothetical protein
MPAMTIPQLSRRLNTALRSDAGLAVLDRFFPNLVTWTEGGCGILAYAVAAWLEYDAQVWAAVCADSPDSASHLFARAGRWIIDGDGVMTRDKAVGLWAGDWLVPADSIRLVPTSRALEDGGNVTIPPGSFEAVSAFLRGVLPGRDARAVLGR